MSIKDMRTNTFNPMQGRLIFAGYKVDETKVKEMLQFMGVKPTDEVVSEAIGYLSAHAMEFNMTNLHQFIQDKGYDKSRLDLRVKKN